MQMQFSIANIINTLGKFGPVFLFAPSVFLLWNQHKKTLLNYYVIGYFINIVINMLLKGVFKQPRPFENVKLFQLALKKRMEDGYMSLLDMNIYGMPSGHAQMVFYSTMYIHLALKNPYISIAYFILSLITMYQRVNKNMHTFFQVIVGSILGCVFAYATFYFSQKNIAGNIATKKDDYGPK